MKGGRSTELCFAVDDPEENTALVETIETRETMGTRLESSSAALASGFCQFPRVRFGAARATTTQTCARTTNSSTPQNAKLGPINFVSTGSLDPRQRGTAV